MSQPTIKRENIAPVALPTESVDVPAIGGVVLVRGMSLPQVLEFTAERRRASTPREGEGEAAAAERASGQLVPLLLSQCVVLDDGQPVYSAAEWAAFAVQHPQPTLELWQVAIRLSGQDAAAEKKT